MTSDQKIAIPLPDNGFDVTEVAVPWKLLTEAGYQVIFATENGTESACDEKLLENGFWGKTLGATPEPREFYAQMIQQKEFKNPIPWRELNANHFAALVLPGGHAPGMRQYLESKILQNFIADFCQLKRPVAAICHGVIAAARATDMKTGKSILANKITTCLPKYMEKIAYFLTFWRIGRHYRTYPVYVQDEVQSILENSTHQFKEGPFVLTKRGTRNDHKYAFVVKDENYISARWPGDAYFFSRTLIEMLKKNTAHFIVLFALLFAACVPKKPNSAVKENSVSNSFSFDDYAKMCYLALGNAPEVDCSTSDLPGKYITQPIGNWKKNTLSEIRLTGEELNSPHSNSQNLTDPESLDPSMKFECINDSWIMGSGTTWPRCNGISVVQKTLSQSPQGEKVTWIASCRLNNDTRISGTGQMGIIGYNETTGATCFFNKSSLKSGAKIPSANSPGADTVYDNWNLIKRSTPCVNCHQSSPWIHSPELMPERMHEVLKDSAFSKNITHKNSLQWLKNPLKINHQTPLVPSGLDKTEAKIRNKGIPYLVVGREQLENVTNDEGRKIFFAGSWTPKRMDPATPKAKYCFACHDNVSAPINPQMEFMFQQRGLGVLDAEFGKNWHDVLFKTKLNQDKLTEFLGMNRGELQDSWKEYIQK